MITSSGGTDMQTRAKVIQHIRDTGKIPVKTPCPFNYKCALAEECPHKGYDHEVEYSCAAARSFPEIYRSKKHEDE